MVLVVATVSRWLGRHRPEIAKVSQRVSAPSADFSDVGSGNLETRMLESRL